MAKSKTVKLKEILIPVGFKKFEGCFIRVHNDTVHTVKLCRNRSLETDISIAVYSLCDPKISQSYFNKSPVLPYSYSIDCFLNPTIEDRSDKADAEDEIRLLKEIVLPRLDLIQLQSDLLVFYDEMETVEYGGPIINCSHRIYAALAAGNYEAARISLDAIFSQNRNALEAMRKQRTEAEHEEACESTRIRQIPLRRIEKMILDGNWEDILHFIEESKRKNISFLLHS